MNPDFRRPHFNLQRTDPCFCGSGRRFKACCGTLADPRAAPHGVHIVPGFLSKEICRQWIQHLESQPRRPLAVHALDENAPAQLAKEHIDGRITDKVEQGGLADEIVARIADAFRGPVAGACGRMVEWFENPQVLRYEPGGLYGPHSDSDHFLPEENSWKKVIDRDVSLLVYLNEEFSGGELLFRQFNYTYRPRTGDLLFFPSHGHYAHQALAVRHGVRYVIVSWAAWQDEPRVLDLRPSDCIYLEH